MRIQYVSSFFGDLIYRRKGWSMKIHYTRLPGGRRELWMWFLFIAWKIPGKQPGEI